MRGHAPESALRPGVGKEQAMGTDEAQGAGAETWAYCDECARWYYCPCHLEAAGGSPRCPVCAAEPEAVRTLPGS